MGGYSSTECVSQLGLLKQITTPEGPNDRDLVSELWRLEVLDQGVDRVGFFSGLFDLQTAVLSSLCPHMGGPPLCVCVLISFSSKDTCHIGLGLTLVTSFYLSYFLKDVISKSVMFQGT